MKLTKSQLKEIIKEELGKVLNEADELQQQLADLNAKADAAKEAGDREAYDALVDQMIELENAHLDAGGKLPLPERYGTQPQPDSQERAMHVLEKHLGAQAAEVKALVELAAEYGRDGKDPMDAVISFYHGVNP